MKEYDVIGNFNYNNKEYTLFIDENNKYYFLRIENKEEKYITLHELLELTNIFSYNEDILLIENDNNKKKKRKLIPKIILGSLIVTLSASLISAINEVNSTKINQPKIKVEKTISYVQEEDLIIDETEKTIQQALKEIEKEEEEYELKTKEEFLDTIKIYDTETLDDVLGYSKEEITYETIRQTIKNNNNIPEKYKELYLTLANNLEKKYPKMDLRVWYENLKTLKICELEEFDMKLKAMSSSAQACYRRDENTIYTVKDYQYIPNTWEYQIIMHEMCHPIKTSYFTKGDKKIRVQFESPSGKGIIIDEAMNSLLALRSYDENEKDIAYQLQSNMIEAMVDSMDNYTYQDYIEKDLSYFQNQLNEQNNDDKAIRMLGLLELQYKDYHNDKVSVEQKQFYELYDYISKMYYEKRINASTSYDDAIKIKDELINRITYDVPEEYNIDINHFQEFFENYCIEKGIQNGITK